MQNPIFSQEGLQRALAESQVQTSPDGSTATTPHITGIGPWPYLALGAGEAADAGSTALALSRSGTQEGNPLLPQNAASIAGLKAAITIPMMIGMHYLAEHGHPTIAKVIGYGGGALGAGIAAHNMTVGR